MTGREKVEAVLSGEGCSETPVVLPYEEIFIRDHWDEVTRLPGWYWKSPKLEHQLAWREEAIRRLEQDWFDLPFCLPRADREEWEIIPEEASMLHRRTGERKMLSVPTIGGEFIPAGSETGSEGGSLSTPEDVDTAVPLPQQEGGETEVIPQREVAREDLGKDDLSQALLQGAGSDRFPLVSVMSPFWNCFKLWDYQELLLRSVDTPKLIRYACERYVKVSQDRIRQAADMGAKGVWIEEGLTDLLHPDSFLSLSLPYIRVLFDEARDLGLKSVYYYTGNPKGKLDAILSAGADAYSFEEKKKGYLTDIKELAEYLWENGCGREILLGNIDPILVLQEGSDDDLKNAIMEQLEAAAIIQNRFIMCLGSPVTPATPLSRVTQFCRMTREISSLIGQTNTGTRYTDMAEPKKKGR